ncbi:hypothetical protein DFP72DRAFT_497619 [Ephemerocybe angulata]|uniref:Uncharacterized protein n=1 Tax=Ephemerocybe angulata TaxID=980116 RepID=A0A8H6M4Q2_9AGAR|nr:hypothetical protein DFP72DRAFT_497619 [Tulosesus angulatus]
MDAPGMLRSRRWARVWRGWIAAPTGDALAVMLVVGALGLKGTVSFRSRIVTMWLTGVQMFVTKNSGNPHLSSAGHDAPESRRCPHIQTSRHSAECCVVVNGLARG